ncbi:Auxilin-related protein 2 [Vitis vinifera]|uniref:Auxilin-related protein 2 n=1 Tax=Vitis vinifera TaxID=29760 RepID=A0A438G5I5_VITVI|nr:Auxilin-related protein 2 [Vitis vinifera]
MNKRGKNRSPWSTKPTSETKLLLLRNNLVEGQDSHSQKKMPAENYWESHQTLFDIPTVSTDSHKCFSQTPSPLHIYPSLYTTHSAPPPSRPPPPRPTQVSRAETENSVAAASAAAMKEAMDRVDAKFRHAKGIRERESAKASRSKEAGQLDRDEKAMQDAQERLERDLRRRGSNQGRLEERENARQAVERATKEAREKAAAEALLKAERAAVEKAAVEAKERAEKAAAEARERANTEAREKEARERATVARAEHEFSTKQCAKARANSSDPMFGIQFQNRHGPEMARTSASASSTMRKASPTTNIVDDLSSIFGAAPSSGNSKKLKGKVKTTESQVGTSPKDSGACEAVGVAWRSSHTPSKALICFVDW